MAKRKEFDLNHMNEESMRQLERKISGIYRDAAKDIRSTVNAYWHGDEKTKGYDARLKEMQARLDAGEITQEYFRLWQRNQLGRGERWEAMKSNVCQRTTQANQIAAAYVNGSTPAIYALNANHTAYQIESRRDEFPDVDFALIDERTVRELASGANHQEFRTLSVNPVRDYKWNSSQIERALTVGIINGDSITHMTDRFMAIMGNNHKAALRNARTAVTSAENAGQHRTMQAAQDMGIDVSKEWSSLPDDRTRESHFLLDGIRAALDEPFPNGLMYPADPAGHPSEVYNCRCTMMNILKGINDYVRIGGEASGGDDKISYEEWLRQKEDAELMPQYDESGVFRGGNNLDDIEHQNDDDGETTIGHIIVEAEDIRDTWMPREGFDFAIDDIVELQGFDGLPRIASHDEFYRAVSESNFIAYRGYCAPDAETLSAYRESLYNGKWYVDCSNGGALYGRGMYAAGIRSTEPDSWMTEVARSYASDSEFGYIETLTLDPSAKIVKYDDIESDYRKYIKSDPAIKAKMRRIDIGSYAALMGYDAIDCAEEDGESSEVVILNRTKLIILSP